MLTRSITDAWRYFQPNSASCASLLLPSDALRSALVSAGGDSQEDAPAYGEAPQKLLSDWASERMCMHLEDCGPQAAARD